MEKKKLNIGCGSDIKKGWVNLDIAALPGVDIVHDIEKLPLPFTDETFDEILCQDVLEHIEYQALLKELHRILKVDGIITIQVPHFTSVNNFIDPTHKNRFSVRTFDFFSKDTLCGGRDYYFDFHFSQIIERRILFNDKRKFFLRRFVEKYVNSSFKRLKFYERSSMCYLFPAENILVVLKK